MKTQTKIVIRRLPRALTRERFLQLTHPLHSFTYFRFCEADKRLGEAGSSRVYIDFGSEDALYDFKAALEGRLIVDDEGNEAFPLVEFAAFQKTPGRTRSDCKQSTLRTDPEYVRFMNEGEDTTKGTILGSVESNLEEIKCKETERGHVTTRLVEYMTNLPKRGRKEDFGRRKHEFTKVFTKKEIDNPETKVKVDVKSAQKNIIKDMVNDVITKSEPIKDIEKIDPKRSKVSRRNDIKAYAASYDEYVNAYEGYTDERSPKKGFENKSHRGGRQGMYDIVEEPKGNSGSYYYNGRIDYSGRADGYYRSFDYYGYSQEYSQGPSYPRSSSNSKPKRGGGGGSRRPPSYSATRKD